MKGISGFCKTQSELEPTADIRYDLDIRYKVRQLLILIIFIQELLQLIADKRELDKTEKADLEKNLATNKSDISSILERFRKEEVLSTHVTNFYLQTLKKERER